LRRSKAFPILLFGCQRRRPTGELHLLKLCYRRCHYVRCIGRFLDCVRESLEQQKKVWITFWQAIFRDQFRPEEVSGSVQLSWDQISRAHSPFEHLQLKWKKAYHTLNYQPVYPSLSNSSHHRFIFEKLFVVDVYCLQIHLSVVSQNFTIKFRTSVYLEFSIRARHSLLMLRI